MNRESDFSEVRSSPHFSTTQPDPFHRTNHWRSPVPNANRRRKASDYSIRAENDDQFAGRMVSCMAAPLSSPARATRRGAESLSVNRPAKTRTTTSTTSESTRRRRAEDSSSEQSLPRKRFRASHDDTHDKVAPLDEPTAPLEATSMASKGDKRTLRSQDGGSRFKSDLAVYFPGLIEDLLGDSDKPPEFLTIDTPLYVLNDEGPRIAPQASLPQSKLAIVGGKWKTTISVPPGAGKAPDALHTNLVDSKIIDFSSIELATKDDKEDPLPDSLFEKPHRRMERQEKQLRNIEKERAQHEKHHLERLLDGLKGHEWLRVMGITGVTDSEKKEYEPKRAVLIREVSALVEKFRLWKEEEKRRKVEKDVPATDTQTDVDGHVSDDDPPDYSDVDASAARQLHLEAIRATSVPHTKPRKVAPHKRTTSAPAPVEEAPPEPEPEPEKPFVSFYSKPYLRAAALATQRRSTRGITAFGQPIPDLFEQAFELSEELTQGKSMLESQRRRRRLKRDSEKEE